MFGSEILFFMQIIMGVLLIVLLKMVLQVKKQVENTIKEINNYISFVTEDVQEEVFVKRENEQVGAYKKTKESQDELQNKLIQSVLGEYFG